MPILNKLTRMAEKESEQQRPDVCPVHVGVSHNDDFMITQLADIPLGVYASTQGSDESAYLIVVQNLGYALSFYIQNLALQGKNGLNLTISPLLGRTSCRVSLHQV